MLLEKSQEALNDQSYLEASDTPHSSQHCSSTVLRTEEGVNFATNPADKEISKSNCHVSSIMPFLEPCTTTDSCIFHRPFDLRNQKDVMQIESILPGLIQCSKLKKRLFHLSPNLPLLTLCSIIPPKISSTKIANQKTQERLNSLTKPTPSAP